MLTLTFTLAAFATFASVYAVHTADKALAAAVQAERDILKRWVSRPDDPV